MNGGERIMTNALKKAGLAAIGASSDLVSSLHDRVDSVRNAIQDLGDRMSLDARRELDDWIQEGEKLVASLRDRSKALIQRGSERKDEIVAAVETGHDVVEGLAATATKPVIPVEAISGIGPKYASRLGEAGVVTTSALLERCHDRESLERLAAQTDISAALLESWADAADLTRIKGIGPDHMETLNAAGVASIADLAAAAPNELAEAIARASRESGFVSSEPSAQTLRSWTAQAKKLVDAG
jgi:predicted flap endonuclease-1-like 5' DNA nuclease